MTKAYYFPKQIVDFEKLPDYTKQNLFTEFKKNIYINEKYSNIFKPFFNKIKDEYLHTIKNIPNLVLDIPNDNLLCFNYENNKFRFSLNTSSFCGFKSSFFYYELLEQLSFQSPFKFFSQKDLKNGLSNTYSISYFEPVRSKNSEIVYDKSDIENVIKNPLLNNLCNIVIKSDSLCTFFNYDKNSNNLNLLKSNIVQYIKDKARNISINKIKVIEKSLQENINKETLDFFNKNISLIFNTSFYNLIKNDNEYNDMTLPIQEMIKSVKNITSEDTNPIYLYDQEYNEFSRTDWGCPFASSFINYKCDDFDLPFFIKQSFPNIVSDEDNNLKIFTTCQEAQDYMLDYLEPWLDDERLIADRDPDRLYEKAKQYLELSSYLNEQTLSKLNQSFNKVKGISTNQSQPKEAKKTKTAGFHL